MDKTVLKRKLLGQLLPRLGRIGLRALARKAEVQADLLAWEEQDRIEDEEKILKQKRKKC